MDQPFALDGYVVTDLIGFGTTGEVWRGRDAATGDPVALKRLWEPMLPDTVTRLRREAAVLEQIAAKHTVLLREVRELPGDEIVLVLEHAAGGSLASLIARRGRLHPSEVVTFLGPLATVLADAHDRGLRHGDITPSNVVFAADGRPMLSDFGLVLLTGEQPTDDTSHRDAAQPRDTTPSPATDVFGVAAVGYTALTGVPPRPAGTGGRIPSVVELAPWVPAALASAVEAGLAADPETRPSAIAFASSVLRSCAASPVRLGGPRKSAAPAAETETAPRRTHRIPRPLALASVVAAVLVLAAIGGVGWAHVNAPAAAALQPGSSATSDGATQASPASHESDYKPIVTHLFALRAKAFATGKLSLLSSVYLSDTYVFDMDHEALQALRSQHLRTRGFTQRVDTIKPLLGSPGWVDLVVTTTIPQYVIIDRSGRVVARRASRTQRFGMTIRRVHGRWLVGALDRKPQVAPTS
ncbi:MAG TPA: serine/threonine-protein kinase [Mycobacteriales bacterium]|nr:serine/threonine-protein kinase [Mycobacteriales bacterium]